MRNGRGEMTMPLSSRWVVDGLTIPLLSEGSVLAYGAGAGVDGGNVSGVRPASCICVVVGMGMASSLSSLAAASESSNTSAHLSKAETVANS